jgi:hypothetical protein
LLHTLHLLHLVLKPVSWGLPIGSWCRDSAPVVECEYTHALWYLYLGIPMDLEAQGQNELHDGVQAERLTWRQYAYKEDTHGLA